MGANGGLKVKRAARRARLLRCLPTALLAATLVLPALAPASATHSWDGHHWASRRYPIALKVLNSVSDGMRQQAVVPHVLERWDDSGKFDFVEIFAGNSPAERARCRYSPGEVRICNANYGPGRQGYAYMHWDGSGHFLGGQVFINDYYGTGYRHRRSVLCEEIGHVLGLHHRDGGADSCLSQSADELLPDRHDHETIASRHQHRHSYDSYD